MVGEPSMEASLVACPEDALPLACVLPLPGCELPLCDPEALPKAPAVWPLAPALWPLNDPDGEVPLALAPLEQATPKQAATKGPRENNGARFSWKSDGNAMENSDQVNVVPWSPTKSVASKRSV